MSKTSKIQCTKYNPVNGMHVEDIEDVFKYMYSSHTGILHRSVDVQVKQNFQELYTF